jgi:cobalamin biosynthesis protein CobD/CbiB
MGAMAGALGIILEKKGCYVLSGGAALPDDEAIGRAVRVAGLSAAVSFLFFSLFSGVLYAISS